MVDTENQFEVSHEFLEVPKMIKGNKYYGGKVTRLGMNWTISLLIDQKECHICLECLKTSETTEWSIEANIEFEVSTDCSKMTYPKEKCCFNQENEYFFKTMNWSLFKRNMSDGILTVKFTVEATNIVGSEEGTGKVFDYVAVIVSGVKLYMNEKMVTSKSRIFHSYFTAIPPSDKQKQIVVNDDVNDFRNLIKYLHDALKIKDSNIGGLLDLAVKYEFDDLVQKFENFMISSTKKPLREQFAIMEKHKLWRLRHHLNFGARRDLCSVPFIMLTCKICFGLLKDIPLSLKCNHSFCPSCIEFHRQRTDQSANNFCCPVCQVPSDLEFAVKRFGVVQVLKAIE